MINNDKIFDSHIHFNDNYKYKDINIDELLKEAHENEVGYFLCASFDYKSSLKAVEISKKYNNIYAGIAIHPNNVKEYDNDIFLKLEKLILSCKKIIAIGETGLDYFYTKEDKEIQKDFLIKHIELSIKYKITLQLHIRDENNKYDAYDDVLEILCKYKDRLNNNVVIHCFSANKEYATKFLNLNCYINIGGAVTFSNARDLQEAVKIIPFENLLLETDAPYLTPHPFRGKINKPKYILLTCKKVAEIKNIDYKKLIKITTNNAKKAYNLEK